MGVRPTFLCFGWATFEILCILLLRKAGKLPHSLVILETKIHNQQFKVPSGNVAGSE